MRKFPFTALAALLIIPSFQTFAFEIRIDSPSGSMENAPRRDQSGFHLDLNNCYAQSGVQYWDAFRYSISKDKNNFKYSSPDFVSVVASQMKHGGDGDYESGIETDVISYLNDYGNCSQEYVNSKRSLYKTIIHSIHSLFDQLSEIPVKNARAPVDIQNHLSYMNSHYASIEQDIRFDNTTIIKKFDATITLLNQQLTAVGRYYTSTDLENKISLAASEDDFIAEVLNFKCPSKHLLRAPPVKIKEITAQNYEQVFSYLAQFHTTLLTHFKSKGVKALPIMIGYCSEIITKGKWFSGQEAIFGVNGADSCGLHASIIIGIRYNETKTPYNVDVLVRNSYGTDCDSYTKDYECNKGDFWIPLWVLDRNLQSYVN